MTTPPPPVPQFKVEVPDELAAGAYSNFVGVWHTAYEFTLDFAVMQPAEAVTDDDGNQQVIIPARVVSRVKIPAAQILSLMQVLSTNEAKYEEAFGPIPKVGKSGDDPPLFPPEG